MKCALCGGTTETTKTSVDTQWGDYEITIHGVEAEKCNKCGEKYFNGNEIDIIQSIAAGFSESTSLKKPDILNIDEVSELLRVSKQTIYNMLKDGRINAFKCGREWRFNKSELLESLNNNTLAVAARGQALTERDIGYIERLTKKGE